MRNQAILQLLGCSVEPRLLETQFYSPQLLLWDLGPDDWYLVVRLPEYAPRRRQTAVAVQLPLLPQATSTG